MDFTRTASVVLMAAAFPRFAAAQVSVTGVSYLQYAYQLKDATNHTNNFDVTRAYVNVLGRFDVVGGRVTSDIYRVADGSLALRLKYAFVTYTPKGSPLTFKFGQMQTPWIDFEENLWDYRMQGPVALDRGDQVTPLAYLSSSDFGAGVDGRWGPDRISLQVALLNGENYNRVPGDKRKDLGARFSVRVMNTDDSSRVGGLRLTAFGQYGKPTTGGTRTRAIGMVSYRSRAFILAGELAFTRDSVTGTTPATVLRARTGRLVSTYAVYRIPQSKVALLARVDLLDPITATANNRQTRFIAGGSYQLSPNLRLLADIDHLTYEGGAPTPALEAVRSQALFQVQFTF